MIKRYALNHTNLYHPEHNLYILSSQDTALTAYETNNIIKKQQIENRKKYLIKSIADWDLYVQQTQNYCLFPEPTAHILELEKTALMNKNFIPLDVAHDDICIIHTSQFKHAFFSHLDLQPNCSWHGIYSPSKAELWLWLSKQLYQKQYSLDDDVKAWFMHCDGITFYHCQQLLEIMGLSYPAPQKLTINDLNMHLGVTQQEWQPLIDAWMLNQKDALMHKLPNLEINADITLLIWILKRNLLVLQALLQGVQPASTIFQEYKIWQKQIPLFVSVYPKLTINKVYDSICLLHEIDTHFKSHQTALAKFKLARLLLEFPYE